jgi:hypothetical protein
MTDILFNRCRKLLNFLVEVVETLFNLSTMLKILLDVW